MHKIIFKIFKNHKLLILLVSLFIGLCFNSINLLQIPPVWPDEALHADVALNIIKENRNGTNLLTGTLPGVEKYGFGYPPFFFYSLALWFKIFGFSIYIQRLFSLFLGSILLFIFFLTCIELIKISNKKNYLSVWILVFAIIVALFMDVSLVKAIHISRPEIEVLVFGLFSLFFYLKTYEGKIEDSNNFIISVIISGFSLSLAFLSHFLAIIFLASLSIHFIVNNPKNFYKKNFIYIFFLSFFVPVIIWLISIFPHISYNINDITLRMRYKIDAPYWIWLVFSSQAFLIKVTYFFYIIILWEMIKYVFINYKKNALLILLLLFFSWIFSYLWQTEYSFVYVVVFSYLAFFYLLQFYLTSNTSRILLESKLFIISLVGIIFINAINSTNLSVGLKKDKYNYSDYTKQLLKIIPDNVSVYISAIPDPYFGFKNIRKNILYEFPVLPTSKEAVFNILNKSDYIIYNQPLEAVVVGNIVSSYINKNATKITEINSMGQYNTIVVKLKPRESRIN